MVLSKSLEAFLKWLKKLPRRHRINLTHNLVNFMPNCAIEIDEKSLEEFEIWLRLQSFCPAKEIGAALAIKGIIDLTVMSGITGASQWKVQAENVDALIEKWSAEPGKENKVAWLQSHRKSLEFNAAQSVKMKEAWIALCKQHFTNEALKQTMLCPDINH